MLLFSKEMWPLDQLLMAVATKVSYSKAQDTIQQWPLDQLFYDKPSAKFSEKLMSPMMRLTEQNFAAYHRCSYTKYWRSI